MKKQPARCKSEDKNMSINVIFTWRFLYDVTIDVILTAENQNYMRKAYCEIILNTLICTRGDFCMT